MNFGLLLIIMTKNVFSDQELNILEENPILNVSTPKNMMMPEKSNLVNVLKKITNVLSDFIEIKKLMNVYL